MAERPTDVSATHNVHPVTGRNTSDKVSRIPKTVSLIRLIEQRSRGSLREVRECRLPHTIGADEPLHFVSPTSTETDPFNVAASRVRSLARALPKRDITVPRGQCRML